VIVVAVAMLGVGSLVTRRGERPEFQFAAGFGIATIVTVVFGMATAASFRWLHAGILTVGLLGLLIAVRRGARSNDALRLLVLSSPLLLLIAGAPPSQWDEFSNWLPKQRFLWDFDRFPEAGLPPSQSVLPRYPYGLAILGYFASRTAGAFIENAGMLFNVVLLAFSGLLVARQVCDGAGAVRNAPLPWGAIALGLLAVTALSPTFVPKIVLTSYLDSATGVMLAFAAVSTWRALEALAAIDRSAARHEAWIAGLAMAALVNLKQVNLGLIILVVVGFAVAALRTRQVRWADAAALLPILLMPPLITWLAWRVHVAANITAGGEFAFRALEQWLWSSASDIALRMMLIASKKGGYFVLMLVLCGFAVRALLRPATPFGRLAIVVAAVFLGYNGFLYIAYLGSFGGGESLGAASYWRYNTQLGPLAVAAAAYGLAQAWREHAERPALRWLSTRNAALVTVAVILVLPATQLSRIRFDVNPAKSFVRMMARDTAALVPPGSVVATLDIRDNGFWALMMRYELGRLPSQLRLLYGPAYDDSQAVRRALDAAPPVSHLWVHVPDPPLAAALGVPLAPLQSYLLVRGNDAWQILRSWPWPGYDDPHRFND